MLKKLLFLFPFLLVVASCTESFPEEGELGDENQVIALKAEPPEVAIGDSTVVTALMHLPQGEMNYQWFLCLPNKNDQSDNLATCINERYEEQGNIIGDCTDDPEAKLCLLTTDASATYTVPDVLWFSSIEKTTYFYFIQLASLLPDPLTSCETAWQTMTPNENCLLTGKRILYNAGDIKNQNPTILNLVHEEQTVDPTGIYTVSSENTYFTVNFDVDSVDEFNPLVAGGFKLEVNYFTTCGKIEPWNDEIRCTSDGTLESAVCEVKEFELSPDLSGECLVYVILRDREFFGEEGDVIEGTDPYVPGLDWFIQRIQVE